MCLVNYEEAINNKIKFAPFEIALKFSYEVPLGVFKRNKEKKNSKLNKDNHFGCHVKRFSNNEDILMLKYSEEE